MQTFKKPLYNLLDGNQLLDIERLSDSILKDVGINLLDDPLSIEKMRSVGALIEGNNVRIDAQTLRSIISQSAPKHFKWTAKSSALPLGLGKTVFTPMFGAPNIRRADNNYGLSTIDDYKALVNLYENTPQIDASGYLLCIAHDIAESTRHLAMAEAHLNLSQKPMMGTVLSPIALKEVAELTKATEFIAGQCKLLHMINATPPLTYQTNPLQCLRQASLLGQGCTVSSYMMMGATSPVSVKASLAQGLAEILIGLALTQLYQPGTCVVGGLFAAEFSMSKMLPAFGTVESQLVQMAGIQLVKRIGVPCRGDGFVTSAKVVDQQANAEGIGNMSASLNAGADLLLHTAGWLENGRCIDWQKIDQDLALLKSI